MARELKDQTMLGIWRVLLAMVRAGGGNIRPGPGGAAAHAVLGPAPGEYPLRQDL